MKLELEKKIIIQLVKKWLRMFEDGLDVIKKDDSLLCSIDKVEAESPHIYRITFTGLDKYWQFYLNCYSVHWVDEAYQARIRFFSVYEPVADRYSYSECSNFLRFEITYKLSIDRESNTLKDIEVFDGASIGRAISIIHYIEKNPLEAVYLMMHTRPMFVGKGKARREVRKHVKQYERSIKYNTLYSLKLTTYMKKLLEKDWADNYSDPDVESEFVIIDNGENTFPRFEVSQICDKLIEDYNKEMSDQSNSFKSITFGFFDVPDYIIGKVRRREKFYTFVLKYLCRVPYPDLSTNMYSCIVQTIDRWNKYQERMNQVGADFDGWEEFKYWEDSVDEG